MKLLLATLLVSIFINPLYAADTSKSGIELDALPWLTGGYYLSGWYGKDHFKYRAVAARINVPDSFVDEGFKDQQITAYAFIVDYFPKRDMTGIWYGAGLEYWQSEVTNKDDNVSAEYENTILTAGLGYVWRLSESLYLNPWAALHIVVAGDEDITAGNNTYHQDAVTASGSIKLGWEF